jgi:hypothetical protein
MKNLLVWIALISTAALGVAEPAETYAASTINSMTSIIC